MLELRGWKKPQQRAVESDVATSAKAVLAGRVEEIRQWFAEHGDALYSFALARVKSRTIAEDLVQDTMLAALQAGERFEGRASPRSWLTGILKHKILDHFRHLARTAQPTAELALERFVEERFNDRGVWRSKPGLELRQPVSELERAELAAALQGCLDRLPPRIGEVFLMVERDGRSVDAVCQELSVSTTNVWTMMYRARIALRDCMASTLTGEPRAGLRG